MFLEKLVYTNDLDSSILKHYVQLNFSTLKQLYETIRVSGRLGKFILELVEIL
jgi:hypothetical protein